MTTALVRDQVDRRVLPLFNAGANRGARLNLRAFEEWNRTSQAVALAPRYVDPLPGRALALREEARQRGILAEAVESRIEDVLQDGAHTSMPLILNLDRAGAVSEVLRQTEGSARTTMGYLLVKFPTQELWSIRFALTPRDTLVRREAIRFFDQMAELSARRGSQAVIGSAANPEHLAAEQQHRSWMASHTIEQFGKLVAGIEPDANPLEATSDGVVTLPLIIHETNTWVEPLALAREFAERPPLPLLRGEAFVVSELSQEGIRFHRLHLRKTDGRISVRGQTLLDHAAIEREQEAAMRERRAREAALALSRAQRQTISRTAPIITTD